MTTEELKVIISAETAKYDKAIKKVQKSATSLQKVLARTFSVAALAAFGKSCLQAASDLEEVQNVVDVAFGDMADEANKFAKDAIRSFGITELQAKRLSSTFMAMTTSMGIGRQTAKTMSLSLTALAADMSSFYNVDLSTAQSALEGVITGNTRALRQFGVVITDATLQEYALSKGIKKSVGGMSSAEKAALRYNYAVHALSLSIGDYARTSNSWANQVRLLVNQFNQLKVALGQILRGVLGPVLIALNKILAVIVAIVQAIASLFGKQSDAQGAVQNVQEYGAGLSDAYDTAQKLQKTIAGFDELNTLQGKGETADVGAGIGGGIDFEIPDLTQFNNQVSEITKELDKWKKVLLILAGIVGFKWLNNLIKGLPWIAEFIATLPEGMSHINKWLNTLFFGSQAIADKIATLAAKVGAFFSGGFFKNLGLALEGMKLHFNMIIKDIINSLGGLKGLGIIALIIAVIARIKELWTTSEEFRTRVTEVFGTLKSGINAVVGAFAPLWECFRNLMATVKDLWQKSIKPSVDAIADLVINLVLTITELVGNILSGPGKDIIAFVVNLVSIVIDVVNSILNAISPFISAFTGFMIPLVIKTVSGLFDVIGAGITWCIGFIQQFTNAWKVAVEAIHGFVHNLAEKISEKFGQIRNSIKAGINGAIDWIEAGINNIISRINNSGILNTINRLTGANIGLNYVYIPRLAKGGVVTTPTIAQVGEYAGARSNPEIVAPQSILKETIDASNGELASVFAQIGMQIVQAIDRKELDVQIGDTTIAKSAARGNRSYQLATGQSLF